MTAAPDVTVADIHSASIVESGDSLSVWLEMSDGSLVAVSLPLDELIQRGHTIEAAPTTAYEPDELARDLLACFVKAFTSDRPGAIE